MPAGLLIRGESGEATDVLLTYDLAAGTEKFYGGEFGGTGAATPAVLADEVAIRDRTLAHGHGEAAQGGGQAQALRTPGDRRELSGGRVRGNQDTALAAS